MLSMRERPRTPTGLLPAPAPLPSLTAAQSRRAAIFGASATAGALMVAPAAAAAADRRVDTVVATNPGVYDGDLAWERLVTHFRSVFQELERMPADTAVGLHAKAQALQIPWVAENAKYTARLRAW